MLEENIFEVNTKLKAYKLIHDPTVLLNLIYSKYGDIEEDFDLLYINQLVYDKSSRYNIFFKEYQFYFNDDEYLKRFYKKYDSKPRIPKLSEYYKNYHVFFCRPRFKDLVISDLIQSYEDDRAELFYKKNFEDSNSKDEDKSDKHNSESLSSLDNITDNKIIFTKKTKKIIDKNLESNCGTLTLTTNSINANSNNNNNTVNDNNANKNGNNYIKKINNDDGLISSRDVNDSFEKIVHNLIYFKKNKKKIDKNKNKNKNYNNIKKKEKTKKDEKPYIQGKNYKNKNNSHNNNINRKVTSFMNNKMSLFTLLKQNNTINYTKKNKSNALHNKNTTNLNEAFFSPKMNKENIHFSTKLEEFKNNLIKPNNNTSHHHQRNKTFNFNQNQTAGMNTVNNLTNIINMKKNNSRNNHLNLNLKQMTQINNFLTVGNNMANGIKVNHNKNKTFDNTPNFNNSLVKKIPTKILPKNNNNFVNKNNENNNQIIIKRNNLVKSKFNLVKNPLNKNNINNKIKLNKNIKNTNFKYYNTKFSPSNCLYKNILANNKNMNLNLHKKNKTTYLSTMFEVSPKNNPASPKIVTKQQKQYYNINKSDNISSKIKPKIAKGRINNLNINFNNVIFNAPLSNINENININNNSNSFNLISVSNNNNNNYRNNGNSNTFLNNNYLNNSSNTNNNLSEENPNDKNIYILNLKNVYNNISRNKTNLYGTSFSQSDNYSLPTANQKINYENNNNNRVINHTYSNLYSNDKNELLDNKKSKISIKKSYNNKSGNQKNSKKLIKNSVKKSNKNIKTMTKNKKNEYCNNNNINKLEKSDKNKRFEKSNASFHCKDNNNNNKNIYLSPKTTGRNNIPQPINVNRNSNLFSKNLTKSRKKIK